MWENIFAIDPGNVESAYVEVAISDDHEITIVSGDKIKNEELISDISLQPRMGKTIVIERVASYGMPVGREIFETCEWIGRFTQAAATYFIPVKYVYRIEEKQVICHDSKATDATIRRALIDKYAKHDLKSGKGTKDNPDFFHGFKKDMWSAFAVAVTYINKMEESK